MVEMCVLSVVGGLVTVVWLLGPSSSVLFEATVSPTVHFRFTFLHIPAGASLKSVLRTLCRSAQSWAAVSLWESSSVGVLGARAAVIHRPIEMDRVVLMEAKYVQNQNPSQNISVNSLVPPIYLLCSGGDRVNTHYSGTSLQSVIHGSWHWPLFTLHPPPYHSVILEGSPLQ